MVGFDAEAVGALITASREAEEGLRESGTLRGGAAENALDAFQGLYAYHFTAAIRHERSDRRQLADELAGLAHQLEEVIRRAAEEDDRQRRFAEWESRDDERRRRAVEQVLSPFATQVEAMLDPRPRADAVVPRPVSASFTPHERRQSPSGPNSVSSADPERLRAFVAAASISDARLEDHLARVRLTWSRFSSSCPWVPVESSSMVPGFERFLAENRAEAEWIAQVASAFEAAGGGELSDRSLDLVGTMVSPTSDQQLLDAFTSLPAAEIEALLAGSPGLASQLTRIAPARIASWWGALDPQPGDGRRSARQQVLLRSFPALLGNLEGLPYSARDRANRTALRAAIAKAEESVAQGVGERQTGLMALRSIRDSLRSSDSTTPRFLVSLSDDAPPLAAVSIGDLDTASTVAFAVPGMGTTTEGMTDWAKASQNLHALLPPGSAVVAWVGYQTPPFLYGGLDVFGTRDAVAGGHQLAGSLGGLAAVRAESAPRLSVVAHSYGSTTAAFALSNPAVHVDNLITLGSAGLPDSVTAATDLNADHVYAGEARPKIPGESESGDEAAWGGRTASWDHHVDPADPDFGATVFGVETGGDTGRTVTGHSTLLSDDGLQAGYLDTGTESLQNVAAIVAGTESLVTPRVPLGPTLVQEAAVYGMGGSL